MDRSLYEDLIEYSGDVYPMHMPGHKRVLPPAPDLPYLWDLTEQEETDDLHHASGILKAAMERTARLCHAGQTRYLVNGSTCGILAAVYACVPHGGSAIIAANCHRSVFHALEILQAVPVIIHPRTICKGILWGSVDPEDIKKALALHPEAAAVVITSPTYEGIVSDIKNIAGIVHAAGKVLITDEAHGAHLGLFETGYFPMSSIRLGSDISVQSFHKTLPSLNQTAVLHFRPESIDADAIDHALSVFETSSPSYPLMASLDGCTRLLETEGAELFNKWRQDLEAFYRAMQDLEELQVLTDTAINDDGVFAKDPSKIVILTGPADGIGLMEQLKTRFGFATEMADKDHVLAMTSPADKSEIFKRFAEDLLALDHELSMGRILKSSDASGSSETAADVIPVTERVFATDIASALKEDEATGIKNCRTLIVPNDEAAGLIAGEYLYRYPPGIPMIIPGEIITKEAADHLAKTIGTIRHSAGTAEGYIRCHKIV